MVKKTRKGGCCGAGGSRRRRKHTGGSVVADALIAVGSLAAWKYFSKKRGGSRLPKRTLKNKAAR